MQAYWQLVILIELFSFSPVTACFYLVDTTVPSYIFVTSLSRTSIISHCVSRASILGCLAKSEVCWMHITESFRNSLIRAWVFDLEQINCSRHAFNCFLAQHSRGIAPWIRANTSTTFSVTSEDAESLAIRIWIHAKCVQLRIGFNQQL